MAMHPKHMVGLQRFGLPVSVVLVFCAVVWLSVQEAPQHESVVAPHEVETPPPAVYVMPDPNPKTSVLGTDASISQDSLRLQLIATAPGKSSHEGTAILGTQVSNPQTYAAGSVLASGAVIEEIFTDHVVLRISGTRTKLFRVGIHSSEDGLLIAATTVGGPGIADRPVDTRVTSQQDFVEYVRPKLVFDGDKLTGFEISAGRNGSRLSALGLESGDVIRTIDGRPVKSDADWQRVATSLSNGSALVLGIERQDSLISIVMDAARLSSNSQPSALASQPPPSM
jgi:hypothetical protein